MNSNELQILVKLKDEASSAFQTVGKNFEDTGKNMSKTVGVLSTDVSGFAKVLGGLAVGAGAAVVGFLYSSAKAAGEAEVAMARVDSMLRTMGDSAMANRSAILKAADAAVRLGFDDEDTAQSITKLYQRTKDLTQAQALNNLAMDLARGKNIDLSEASNLVGQVLSGNGRVLKQYGIELNDSLTPLEALKQLQTQVAGQAEAFSKTFQGQMQVLAVNFTNIKEIIGSALLDALGPFVKQFNDWLMDPKTKASFAVWTENFKSWADVIIPTIVGVFELWFNILEKIFEKIIDIGDGIVSLVEKSKNIGSTVVDAWKNAPSNLKWFFGGMKAEGGPVSSGQSYIVGERGPEMFMPSTSGTIIPNNRLGMGGGAAVVVNLSGNFYGTDESASRKFADEIARIITQQLKVRTI